MSASMTSASAATGAVCCSAPGKVLLAGGYLVLDRAYSGLVIGLDARIYTTSEPGPRPGIVSVRSPQFSEAVWEYEVDADSNVKAVGSSRNPFVETTLRYVLAFVKGTTVPQKQGVSITILADNSYYSQPAPDVPRFNALNVPITSAHKTGLGSSAALVTSLTASLLSLFEPETNLEKEEWKSMVHNLAQAAHCAAQGKVGSGFDVAAAVYGSCVYRRFSPGILEAVGEAGSEGFRERLASAVEKAWDHQVVKTGVPQGLRLVMGDVDCGSSTPGMVKKVLAWRKSNPSDRTWDVLLQHKDTLATVFSRALSSNRAPTPEELESIAVTIAAYRTQVRAMGTASDVPIEPVEQTALLDSAKAAVPQIVEGVVPGAGGYDAVAFLIRDDPEAVSALEGWLKEYKFGEKGGKVEALKTREEYEGVRREDVEGVLRDAPRA